MTIEILENREMLIMCPYIGTQTENNATEIEFIFPESIDNGTKTLIINNETGSRTVPITNNKAILTQVVTNDRFATIQVVVDTDTKHFITKPYNIQFYEAIDSTGVHRNYLTFLDFEIDENGHLIMEWEGGNIDFNLNGNDLEVDI